MPSDRDPPRTDPADALLIVEDAHERLEQLLDQAEAVPAERRAAEWPRLRSELERELGVARALLRDADRGAEGRWPVLDPLSAKHQGQVDRLIGEVDAAVDADRSWQDVFGELRRLLSATFTVVERRLGSDAA